MEKHFLKLWGYLMRDQEVPMEIRLFRLIALTNSLLCIFIIIPTNLLQNLSPYVNEAIALYGIIVLYLYRCSWRGRHFIKSFCCFTVLVLNLTWLMNGGSNGSVGFFFLAAVIYPLIFFRGITRQIMFLLLLLDNFALLVLEHKFPYLVVPFKSANDRLIDLVSGFSFSAIAFALVFWVVRVGLTAGNYVKLAFADEGCGICEKDKKRIFDPYFTTKVNGAGLGLASTYAIIDNHGGQIPVDSPIGKGTTFTVYLPSLGKIDPERASQNRAVAAGRGCGSILVMDDDEMIRELASMTLERFGYAVTACLNGEQAISLYASAKDAGTPFSVVIMDLTIPGGMGGAEAARRILALDPEAKLIVSSGYSDDPVMSNYKEYGFSAAIEKPYKPNDIARILAEVGTGPATRSFAPPGGAPKEAEG